MANLIPLTVADNALRRVLLNQNLERQKADTSEALLQLSQRVTRLERLRSEVKVDTFGVVVEVIND